MNLKEKLLDETNIKYKFVIIMISYFLSSFIYTNFLKICMIFVMIFMYEFHEEMRQEYEKSYEYQEMIKDPRIDNITDGK